MKKRQEVSICYWKSGTKRLAGHRAATNLEFVKTTTTTTKKEKRKQYL